MVNVLMDIQRGSGVQEERIREKCVLVLRHEGRRGDEERCENFILP